MSETQISAENSARHAVDLDGTDAEARSSLGYMLLMRGIEAGADDFASKPFNAPELRARVHNILEVRLLHLESKNYSKALEETVRELEASREVIRLKTLEEQKKSEQELALA